MITAKVVQRANYGLETSLRIANASGMATAKWIVSSSAAAIGSEILGIGMRKKANTAITTSQRFRTGLEVFLRPFATTKAPSEEKIVRSAKAPIGICCSSAGA